MPPYSEMSFELLQKQSPNMPSPLSLAGVEVLFHAFVSSHRDQYAPFAGLPVPARIINRLKLVHHAPTILHQAPGERHAHSQPSSCTHVPGMLKQVQGADCHYFSRTLMQITTSDQNPFPLPFPIANAEDFTKALLPYQPLRENHPTS